jgi:hypothetical protein
MSTTEAGDPTNYPTSITIPSDGDGPIKAADVNVAFEGLADRTAYAYARLTQGKLIDLSPYDGGNYTTPADLPSGSVGILFGCGGGGGGGGGAQGVTGTGTRALGGSGGGSALLSIVTAAPLEPSTNYAIAIGAGGGGGGTAANGNNGGDTSFAGLIFRGAQGGKGGAQVGVSAAITLHAGGEAVRGDAWGTATNFSAAAAAYIDARPRPQEGGAVSSYPVAFGGGPSERGYPGGAAGNTGSTAASHYGGVGGGGGGGAAVPGADGGDGGNGNSGGLGVAGTSGSNGTDGEGGGGGGGGGGGAGSTGGGSGAAGGDGGDGFLYLVIVTP